MEGLAGLLRDTSRPRKIGSAERKEDVTSDWLTFQEWVQFYALRNRGQRITEERGGNQAGIWNSQAPCKVWEHLHRRQAQGRVDPTRNMVPPHLFEQHSLL